MNLDHTKVAIDPDKYPKTKAYVDAILARPSYAGWVAQEKAIFAA